MSWGKNDGTEAGVVPGRGLDLSQYSPGRASYSLNSEDEGAEAGSESELCFS